MLRKGQGLKVSRELRGLKPSSVNEQFLAPIANLAWRVNQPQVGLRLILPFIKKKAQMRSAVGPEIQAEHAGCLLEVGAISESKLILKDVSKHSPRARFYQALLHFKQWDYESACPLLESYLETLEDSYHRLVVKVNLASAYVVTHQFEKALSLCDHLEKVLLERKHLLLLGNSYEIASQVYFHKGQHERALHLLKKGEDHLSQTKNMGWLYCKKWELINQMALSNRAQTVGLNDSVDSLKKTAIQMQSWETAREIDFHWALTCRDLLLLSRVYFGSPMPKYREQVLSRAKDRNLDLSEVDSYLLTNDNSSLKQIQKIEDLILESGESLHSWLPKKLLLALLSDFYAPFRTGNIFSLLFDQERYDPDTSPDKVFQIVRRLRSDLDDRLLELKIDYSDNGYRLNLGQKSAIQISRMMVELTDRNRASVYAWILRHRIGTNPISSAEISQEIGASTRSGNRILKELVDQNLAEKTGNGRATKYKLTG